MTLMWGRHYLMVEPEHYRIDYAINPFMDPADQPDARRAAAQWRGLVDALTESGALVETMPSRPDAPDMTYAMNLGLAYRRGEGERRVVMSHMRYPQRRVETGSAAAWFARTGRLPSYVGRDGVGPVFEAGDAFPYADGLLVGVGPRTDELALKALAAEMGVRVRGVRTTHPGMYHLDLAFCPLDERRAIVCPDAFDAESARALLDLVAEPLVISEEEALTTFCANSVVIGDTVVMPGCPDRVRRRLESWGFGTHMVEVDEFHKGGGSIRCLTNPLDITLGRDLRAVPGGEVVIAPQLS